jgi:hypothetical protein
LHPVTEVVNDDHDADENHASRKMAAQKKVVLPCEIKTRRRRREIARFRFRQNFSHRNFDYWKIISSHFNRVSSGTVYYKI